MEWKKEDEIEGNIFIIFDYLHNGLPLLKAFFEAQIIQYENTFNLVGQPLEFYLLIIPILQN